MGSALRLAHRPHPVPPPGGEGANGPPCGQDRLFRGPGGGQNNAFSAQRRSHRPPSLREGRGGGCVDQAHRGLLPPPPRPSPERGGSLAPAALGVCASLRLRVSFLVCPGPWGEPPPAHRLSRAVGHRDGLCPRRRGGGGGSERFLFRTGRGTDSSARRRVHQPQLRAHSRPATGPGLDHRRGRAAAPLLRRPHHPVPSADHRECRRRGACPDHPRRAPRPAGGGGGTGGGAGERPGRGPGAGRRSPPCPDPAGGRACAGNLARPDDHQWRDLPLRAPHPRRRAQLLRCRGAALLHPEPGGDLHGGAGGDRGAPAGHRPVVRERWPTGAERHAGATPPRRLAGLTRPAGGAGGAALRGHRAAAADPWPAHGRDRGAPRRSPPPRDRGGAQLPPPSWGRVGERGPVPQNSSTSPAVNVS